MRVTREIKTAILVIASILLFIWGYSFLKGRDLFTHYTTFYANYDNVEGLAVSAPVTINGLVVGKVNKISLDPSTHKPTVEVQVRLDFELPKNSTINLYEPGLIGGKQIQIVPGSGAPFAQSGDYLTGKVVPGLTALVADKLTPLQEKVEMMVVSADTVLTNLNKVLDTQTRANLKSSIANLNATLAEFRQASAQVNGLLADNKQQLGRTVDNFEKTSANFAKISDTIAKADLGKTIRKMETTLASVDKIMSELNSGKGTMGKLLKDDALYTNFTKTSKELELLLQDLRLNPTRYINVSLFGKKNKPYKAPTDDPATSKK